MVCQKDVIGKYESSYEWWSNRRMWLVETKVCPKDDPSKGCDWPRRKSFQRMLRRILIGWDEATCLYNDASALSSCQTDLIGREGNLVFSSWTRLICLSDGLVLIRTLLIGRSADQLPASSFGLLSHAMSDSQTRFTRKRLRESVFFGRRKRRSDLFLTPKQTKGMSPCFT